MTSPWKKSEKAYAPMMDEKIVVEKKSDNTRQTLTVCVFISITDDPFSTEALDANAETITVVTKKCDCDYVRSLRRGDVITRPEMAGRKYTIQQVRKDELMDWIITAREIKK
jgi:hypothetical protein